MKKIYIILIFAIYCSKILGQNINNDTNVPNLKNNIDYNITDLNSICIKINKSYLKNISKVDSIKSLRNDTIYYGNQIVLCNLIELGDIKIEYLGYFNKTTENVFWGVLRDDNFIKSYLIIENDSFCLQNTNAFCLECAQKYMLSYPFTIGPHNLDFKTGFYYHFLNLNDIKYYIFDTNPFGCNGTACCYNYLVILKIDKNVKSIFVLDNFLCASPPLNKIYFGDLHNDGNLDGYLFYYDKYMKGNIIAFPFSFTNDRFEYLKSDKCYYFDCNKMFKTNINFKKQGFGYFLKRVNTICE